MQLAVVVLEILKVVHDFSIAPAAICAVIKRVETGVDRGEQTGIWGYIELY